MDDKTHAYWSAYVRALADQLQMRDWVVTVVRESPNDPGCIAENQVGYGRKAQLIAFNPAFYLDSREEQRQTVIHELLHAHFYPLHKITSMNEDMYPDSTSVELYTAMHRHELEVTLDSLASAIAPFLPLPVRIAGGE